MRGFVLQQEIIGCEIVGQAGKFSFAIEHFWVATELERIGRNCVTTEDFQVATQLAMIEELCLLQ